MSETSFIKINTKDTVVVCLRPYHKGETITVDGKVVRLLQDTPAGHKVLRTPRKVRMSSSTVTPSATRRWT